MTLSVVDLSLIHVSSDLLSFQLLPKKADLMGELAKGWPVNRMRQCFVTFGVPSSQTREVKEPNAEAEWEILG